MDLVKDIFKNLKVYKDALNYLDRDNSAGLFGWSEGATGAFVYTISEDFNNTIVICKDETRCKKVTEDLKSLGKKAWFYPAKDLFFYEREYKTEDNLKERLQARYSIYKGDKPIIVTTFRAVRDKILNSKIFTENIRKIEFGMDIDLDEFVNYLLKIGYERTIQTETLGEFSIRGGIIDIYSPNGAFRIELFDTEVDSIRKFDIESQRSLENLDECEIVPVKELILDEDEFLKIKNKIENKIKKTKDKVAKERLEEKFGPYLDALESFTLPKNIDLILPFIYEKYLSSIVDYMEDSLFVLEDPRFILDGENDKEEIFLENLSDLMSRGEITESFDEVRYKIESTISKINKEKVLSLNTLLNPTREFYPKMSLNINMKSVVNYLGRIKVFVEDLKTYLYKGYKVLIMSGSEKKAKRLISTLNDNEIAANFSGDRNMEILSSMVVVTTGTLNEGFEIRENKTLVLNHGEILNQPQKKNIKKKKENTIVLKDLKIGDYVVHEIHGIGVYNGTKTMDIQGIRRDYLELSYQGDDRLFLPVENLDVIHKFVGNEGIKPKINKLSSKDWQKQKSKAKKAVEEMAKYLIDLYAKRANAKGFAFSEDTPWQGEFEDAFIYEETEGQLNAIKEIKEDMESPTPMDRLLCADVGYGKTEVAIRAAFKAVMDGKQVAVLVPTTILAQQHYNTFVERFKDFPVSISVFSRFRTKKEIDKDIDDLKKGFIDIAIGTHRLLSKDVKFKDLGLIIVDEEQRFGVRHKETLKLLKESVDSLTLTATPIPRTLQMSMIGIRDMSVIEEPPEERFPIQTYVTEENDMLIREAILKEIERGGQVYYVSNRVSNMEEILLKLKKLVPEATFGIANGQMSERVLEDTMLSFINQEIDVLICSTIIETGMDVPNANTMIVTESNRLGLSQLYQLRGRIGRSNRLAYVYFTYRKNTEISEIASKRLKSIKEFTEFGSGYKIAMRDLEIRGSGSILGEKQHGHIESIGYDLYIKYLKDAVKELKGEEVNEEVDTVVDLKVDSYIPKDYIEDEETVLEIYKKIATIETLDDYRDLVDELVDRFSDIPKNVINLMDISYMRQMAKKSNIVSIIERNGIYTISFLKGNLNPTLLNEIKYTIPQSNVDLKRGIISIKGLKDPLNNLKKLISVIYSHR